MDHGNLPRFVGLKSNALAGRDLPIGEVGGWWIAIGMRFDLKGRVSRLNSGFIRPETYAPVSLDVAVMDGDTRQFVLLEHHDDTRMVDKVDLFTGADPPLFDNRADAPFQV